MRHFASELLPLDFIPVTLEEAAAVHLQEPLTAKKPKTTYLRRPLPRGMLNLLPDTRRWAVQLPRGHRPLNLAAQYPRLANVLALSWSAAPAACKQHLAELLVDNRGGREGFSAEIVRDLMALRGLHEQLFPAESQDIWEHAIRETTLRARRAA